jgi:CRISPR-associated protein Cas2
MSMTVVVTRDVDERYRGFLSSVMLEASPGVYVGARLSAKCREQVWSVVSEWYGHLLRGSIIILWSDSGADGGFQVRILGSPPRVPVLIDGAMLMSRPRG